MLGLPLWLTEQYRKGLGPIVPEIAAVLASSSPIEKVTFSACGAPALPAALAAESVRDVVLCGIETHVCVT